MNNLKDIPDIPNDLIDAASAGRLVVFIGAGVSRIIGCPSWKKFAVNYLESLYLKKIIDYQSYSRLKNLEPRHLLSICDLIAKKAISSKKLIPPNIKEFFKADDDKVNKYPIYETLYNFNAVYLTTNFDDHLDNIILKNEKNKAVEKSASSSVENPANRELAKKIFYLKYDLLTSNLNIGSVLHLHGSINDKESMILTTRHYLEHYQIDSEVTELLKHIFSEKTVLFVGYGLDEYEILEYLIHKQTAEKKIRQHFMLFPMFKSELNDLYNHQKMYFDDLGIELIPYPIDKNGYEQLYDVLLVWSKQIGPNAKPPGYYDKLKIIDEVL